MKNKGLTDIGLAIACVGLAYLAFEYESILAGIGAFIALISMD